MATYYVDNTLGNDSWDGLAPAWVSGLNGPWKTVTKVNAISFAAGDSCLFKRGETWTTQLTPASSGADGNPIIFGAYGSGTVPPVITGGTNSLNTNSKNYLTLRQIIFSTKEILITGSTGIILEYFMAKSSGTNGVKALNSPSTVLRNFIIVDSRDDGVLSDGATSVVVATNGLIVGNGGGVAGSTYGGGGLNVANGGSLTYDHCVITGNGYRPDWNVRAGTDGGNNQVEILPRVTTPLKNAPFYMVLMVDDANYAYVQAIASAIAPYSGHLTFFIIPTSFDVTGQAALAALAAAGHEIAVHAWSHANLTSTQAFALTSTNTNPTIDVDVLTTTIILWCDEVGNRVTFSWAGNKTIGDLKTAVASKGWTITNKSSIADTLRLACLADSAGAQAVPYTPLFDVSTPTYAFWDQEINATRDWIATVTGITPKTMSYPFGSANAALYTWLVAQGYEGARGTNTVMQTLNSIPLYLTRGIYDIKGDGTEAVVRARTRHYYELSRHTARMVVHYIHGTTELSPAQWGWIVNELSLVGATLQTFGSFVTAIRASHTPSGDGQTWTKTYADVGNFNPLSGSPCIDVGANVGLTQDIIGSAVPQGAGVDVGAYEFPNVGQPGIYAATLWSGGYPLFRENKL